MRGTAVLLALLLGTFAACSPPAEVPAPTSIAVAPPGGFPTPDPLDEYRGDCPVTLPNERPAPSRPVDAQPALHGIGEMWTSLPVNGILRPIGSGGGLSFRWWFYRPTRGAPIEVTGERLDANAAPPLRANFDLGAAASTFEVSGELIFPEPGCWRVTVLSVGTSMVFVVQVQRRR